MRKLEGLDKIWIKNLEVFGNHGVLPEENVLGQKFLVNVCMYVDIRSAGQNDNLEESVSYADVAQFITAFMRKNTFQLIESVAEHMAHELLLQYPRMEAVTIEIMKPWAPIGLPVDTVSVEVTRYFHKVYLSIGSNMGDRRGYLDMAVKELEATEGTYVERVTSYIETEAYGGVEQDDFLNAAVELRTLLEPKELLNRLHEIEAKADRERKIHWGPRTLDLDIVFYDEDVVRLPDLNIPHIDMANRDFVLRPLMELCPEYEHPLLRQTVAQLYQKLKE